jgi:hypothetical protein
MVNSAQVLAPYRSTKGETGRSFRSSLQPVAIFMRAALRTRSFVARIRYWFSPDFSSTVTP